MIKVDLITGFLGSGKTTFLKKYAHYFMDRGIRIGILENDYGAVNVDMLLLNELRGDYCELEMVAGGCDAECHARRFKTKLISMAMSGYKRVIVEPSGIFDLDEFFDVLREEPLDRWYEIGSVIAIADARLEDDLSADSDFYLASETAHAGLILLSRTQLTDRAHIEAAKEHIRRAQESCGVRRSAPAAIWDKSWDRLTDQDMDEISRCGYQNASYIKQVAGRENDYSTVYFLELPMTRASILEKLPLLMTPGSHGNVFRIKGFFREEDQWYQLNATRKETELEKIPVGQQVLIVIGENLSEPEIRSIMERN